MSFRLSSKADPAPTDAVPPVDTAKRYDVYCSVYGRRPLVYRNVAFKGVKGLWPAGSFDIASQFVELEQANGQTIFVSRHGIAAFCEHGTDLRLEFVE